MPKARRASGSAVAKVMARGRWEGRGAGRREGAGCHEGGSRAFPSYGRGGDSGRLGGPGEVDLGALALERVVGVRRQGHRELVAVLDAAGVRAERGVGEAAHLAAVDGGGAR